MREIERERGERWREREGGGERGGGGREREEGGGWERAVGRGRESERDCKIV